MLARIGLNAARVAQAINCDDFKDNVRVMYCLNTQQLNPRFLRVIAKMAKAIGLDGFVKFNEIPVTYSCSLKRTASLISSIAPN
jgi:hypothetical protein